MTGETTSRQNHLPVKYECPGASRRSPWRPSRWSAAYRDNLSTTSTRPLATCDECVTWHCHRRHTEVTNDAECCIHYKRCRCKRKRRDFVAAHVDTTDGTPEVLTLASRHEFLRLVDNFHAKSSATIYGGLSYTSISKQPLLRLMWHSEKLLNIPCDDKTCRQLYTAFFLEVRRNQR